MKRSLSWCLTLLMLVSVAAYASGGGLENAQKIASIKASDESLWQFLIKLPGSFEMQIIYGWALAVAVGMLFTWFSKWKVGLTDVRYFVDNYKWTIGSIVTSLSVGFGGIATNAFETSGGEFIGWWSVLYHGGVAGAAIDWAVNKGNGNGATDGHG